MTGPSGKDPIAVLAQSLANAGIDCTGQDMADAYWLMRVMVAGREQASENSAPGSSTTHRPTLSFPPPSPEEPLTPATNQEAPPSSAAETLTVTVHLAPKEATPTGMPVEVPAPSALPDPRVVLKALRPLSERAPSRHRQVFDAEATARRRAEERILEPVLAPVRERWLHVSLLLDVSASMDIWRPTLADVRELVEKAGAFRSVRVWELLMDGHPLLRLAIRGDGQAPGSAARPQEILGLGGRTLVLLVTDCVSPAWSSVVLGNWLREWSRLAVVGILQVLPPRMWQRTSLGDAQPGKLRPLGGQFSRGGMWQPDWPFEESIGSAPVPVVPLTPVDLADLANFLAGRGRTSVRGYRMLTDLEMPRPIVVGGQAASPLKETGDAIVRDFRIKRPTVSKPPCSSTPHQPPSNPPSG